MPTNPGILKYMTRINFNAICLIYLYFDIYEDHNFHTLVS